jgi:hypothetical protein
MIALSYSRISDFRQCPNKFNLKYIKKAKNFQILDADKNINLIRGNNVHEGLKNYVIKKKVGEDVRPSNMREIRETTPLVDNLLILYDLLPEKQIAINDKFELVEWYSKDAWFRSIYDLIGFGRNGDACIFNGDYKTGKLTDYSGSIQEMGQLHMFALLSMALWSKAEKVETAYLYVDHKKTIRQTFLRDQDFSDMKESLIKEHQSINEERDFLPVKYEFCKWCDALPDQCQHRKVK